MDNDSQPTCISPTDDPNNGYGYDDKDAILLTEIDWEGGNYRKPRVVYLTPEHTTTDATIQAYLVATFGAGTTGYAGYSPEQIL